MGQVQWFHDVMYLFKWATKWWRIEILFLKAVSQYFDWCKSGFSTNMLVSNSLYIISAETEMRIGLGKPAVEIPISTEA